MVLEQISICMGKNQFQLSPHIINKWFIHDKAIKYMVGNYCDIGLGPYFLKRTQKAQPKQVKIIIMITTTQLKTFAFAKMLLRKKDTIDKMKLFAKHISA